MSTASYKFVLFRYMSAPVDWIWFLIRKPWPRVRLCHPWFCFSACRIKRSLFSWICRL